MTAAQRLEFLVEETSMEAFLRELLPRLLPEGCAFEIRTGTPMRPGRHRRLLHPLLDRPSGHNSIRVADHRSSSARTPTGSDVASRGPPMYRDHPPSTRKAPMR